MEKFVRLLILVVLLAYYFFKMAYNDRVYGHLAVTVSRDVPFAGAFAVVERQSELKISEANAGAKTAKCKSANQ
jgi:uncharacterized membrane protein